MSSRGNNKRTRDELESAPSSSPPPTTDLPPFSEDSDFEENELPSEFQELPDDDELEDDEGVDLFGENMEKDYRENARKDHYESDDIDDNEYNELDIGERAIVDAKLNRRDREKARLEGHLPAAFIDDEDDDMASMLVRRRRHQADEAYDDMLVDNEIPAPSLESLKDIKGHSLEEWIVMEGPRQAIKREFHDFLTTFINEKGESVYGQKMKEMCEANGESLEISFEHLSIKKPVLSVFLANSPLEVLKIFDNVAFDVVNSIYEGYERIKSEIHVRITDLPSNDSLRDLRQNHLNCLVRVSGVVTRRTGVFSQLKYVKYNCAKCNALIGPYYQDTTNEIRIKNCPSCSSKGPFTVNSEQTIYRNYQKMTLQESPGSVPAGRLPRHREVILLWDLIDSARPGEEVEVTGIYRNNFDAALNTKNGFPVFATIIEANYISKKQDIFASFRLTEDDKKEILKLSKDERISKRIIKSIAPSIYGHEDIKTAIALSMFGGTPKNPAGKHRIRGDINVLMLGDPGTAKSQFLKYVEKTAHRAVYTTGQGASAVGLTASVRRDPITREWTLEGGALVLADKGVCLIDEFDKMNDADRTSIHEAMEQQTISISKAGIVTTLSARCAIIAAANPIRGRYNSQIPFSQNVELTEPILSRFDVLCVVKDNVDPIADGMLAKFVVDSHVRSHPLFMSEDMDEATETVDPDIIPQDLLKKYIMYARDKVHVKIGSIDKDKISSLYADLRRASMVGDSIPITVRHLESIVRMAEAHARMHLRDHVLSEDVNIATSVMLNSFINAQKYSVTKSMRKHFAKYIGYSSDNDELLYHILMNLVKEQLRLYSYREGTSELPNDVQIDSEVFEMKAKEMNIQNIHNFYNSKIFKENGFKYDSTNKYILKVLRVISRK